MQDPTPGTDSIVKAMFNASSPTVAGRRVCCRGRTSSGVVKRYLRLLLLRLPAHLLLLSAHSVCLNVDRCSTICLRLDTLSRLGLLAVSERLKSGLCRVDGALLGALGGEKFSVFASLVPVYIENSHLFSLLSGLATLCPDLSSPGTTSCRPQVTRMSFCAVIA